ncbi:hypothetical protein EVAR_98218_1 [Eumeta japonica]|uniref:Uncharacterized protein n=1 Tax=Eumeta variegata TaxID=151549 RepID=A0A4C1Y413_EUMVA|nr:hypothetical protein EVAR_98218_1 [Eumeta japonica]
MDQLKLLRLGVLVEPQVPENVSLSVNTSASSPAADAPSPRGLLKFHMPQSDASMLEGSLRITGTGPGRARAARVGTPPPAADALVAPKNF